MTRLATHLLSLNKDCSGTRFSTHDVHLPDIFLVVAAQVFETHLKSSTSALILELDGSMMYFAASELNYPRNAGLQTIATVERPYAELYNVSFGDMSGLSTLVWMAILLLMKTDAGSNFLAPWLFATVPEVHVYDFWRAVLQQ